MQAAPLSVLDGLHLHLGRDLARRRSVVGRLNLHVSSVYEMA
jgi:hypothetical protein